MQEEKQNYLRSQIIDGGYSPQAFVQHLSALKAAGEDLANWTLPELQEVVQQFKALNPKSPLEGIFDDFLKYQTKPTVKPPPIDNSFNATQHSLYQSGKTSTSSSSPAPIANFDLLGIPTKTYSSPPSSPAPPVFQAGLQPKPLLMPQPQITIQPASPQSKKEPVKQAQLQKEFEQFNLIKASDSQPKKAPTSPAPTRQSWSHSPQTYFKPTENLQIPIKTISPNPPKPVQIPFVQRQPIITKEKVSTALPSALRQTMEVSPAKHGPRIVGDRVRFQKYQVTQQAFCREVQCQTFRPAFKPSKPNVRITVTDPVKESQEVFFGLSATSFLMFRVQSIELGWCVRRRYSDFQQLRAWLLRNYPAQVIPPIPRKNKNKKTLRDLQKRMKMLQFFLNDLTSCPEIFHSPLMAAFLSEQDRERYEKTVADYANTCASDTPTLQCTAKGTVRVRIDQNVKRCSSSIHDVLLLKETKYKELTRSSKQLQRQFRELQGTLYGMAGNLAELHQCFSSFNQKFGEESTQTLGKAFVCLNNLCVEWADNFSETVDLVEQNFTSFFKYMRHQTYSFIELADKVKRVQEDYMARRKALNQRKQKLFASGDPSRWEGGPSLKNMSKQSLSDRAKVMPSICVKQQYQLQKNRDIYAFFGNALFEGVRNGFELCARRTAANFSEFSVKNKVNTQLLTSSLGDLSDMFDRLQFSKLALREKRQIKSKNHQLADD